VDGSFEVSDSVVEGGSGGSRSRRVSGSAFGGRSLSVTDAGRSGSRCRGGRSGSVDGGFGQIRSRGSGLLSLGESLSSGGRTL